MWGMRARSDQASPLDCFRHLHPCATEALNPVLEARTPRLRPGGPPLLELEGVWKCFLAGTPACGARVQVLRGVSFVLHPRDIVGIMGPRGSGKSTLLRCVAGLLAADAGAVRWRQGGAAHAGVLLLDGLLGMGNAPMHREAAALVHELVRAGGGAVLAERTADGWVAPPTRVYQLRHGVLRRAGARLLLVRGGGGPSVDRLVGSL